MEPIVIISHGNEERAIECVEALCAAGASDITVYGDIAGEGITKASIILPEDATLSAAAAKVAGRTYERITIVNAPSFIDCSTAQILIDNIKVPRPGFFGIESEPAADCIDIADLSVDNLVSKLANCRIQIPEIISVPVSLLRAMPEDQAVSAQMLTMQLVIAALASGEELEMLDASQALKEGERALLSSDEICHLIRFAIMECNIEDLFPGHAWAEHEKESLSFCYHTLAGIFLRLGDLESASECLTTSEQFEDSPRLLALRGMIASLRGKPLEAVANLVSSLQQYEERKRNNGTHYLTFIPDDYEQMNSDLKDGLEALHRRDNAAAFKSFSKAIFNFDSFFRQVGLESKRQIN